MDYQQPHGYMGPPPPPAADPYQRHPPSVPAPPPNHPWPYSATQFQYQPQTQHSPSPPPPPPQWPPPHSEHAPYSSHPPHYPAHQPPPYPAHPHYPLPPRPPHVPQSYSQDWGSGSWSHHQSWQYPSNNNEEDWGAKAKAWAAAKAATENQQPSSQFVPAGRPEEQNHFRDQYSQSNDPQFLDVHTQLAPASNYQQYPGAVGPPNRTGLGQLQDSQYISSGQSSYAADMHVTFAARDGSQAGDSIAPSNPLVHQQEVPSSYSSVAGNEEAGDRYEKFNSFSSLSVAPLSQHHVQPLPPPPAGGRSGWMEEPHNFGSMPVVSAPDLSDQPLNFAPHFNRNLDPHAQPNYTHSSGGPVRGGEPTVTISSNYAWTTSTAQGAVFPPVPLSIPSGAQVDHPIAMPSPAFGHSAPMFPTGPSFQPTVPMMGAVFGVGAVAPHPTAFPGDAYGVSERPKKAAVPNWLREEIIKNKAVITSSAPDITKDDSQSIEEDSIDKSSRKGYQVDSKSIDPSRSTEDEDEDEDEDEVEAARTAAINQEIKRVLTEVLLKVTDELFDEIATKVLKEDDLSAEVGRDVDLSNHQISLSTQSVLTPKASAKVLIPIKTKESDYEDASEKSTSDAPGDVLGLGSYASDEEIQSSGKLNSKESYTRQQYSSSKLLEGNPVNENGGSPEATEEQRIFPSKLDSDGTGRKSPVSATPDSSVANVELSANRDARDLASSDDRRSSNRLSRITDDESNISKLNTFLGEKAVERNEDRYSDARRLTNVDSGIQDTRNRYDKNDRLESRRSSAKKDHKDSESSKERLDKKGDEEHGRRSRTERTDYHDNSNDKGKEKGRTDEKVKNTESRKRLSPSKEGTTETQRDKRASGKQDNNERKQDRMGDEKRERSRHKSESESSQHKRRRSSSVGVRGRESKDNIMVSRANDSSDESSDDSRRKSHHSKRRKSPSPIRSRKRQVSRSPHSKHSKRRHSPYTSLETTRGERSTSRSRSRSAVHRRR